MDFGCIYEGYCSDMTRTVVIGKADADMKKVYQTVLDAQLAAIAAVREGVTGAELDRVARDIIYGAGYEGCFGHGLGHGVVHRGVNHFQRTTSRKDCGTTTRNIRVDNLYRRITTSVYQNCTSYITTSIRAIPRICMIISAIFNIFLIQYRIRWIRTDNLYII